MHVPAAQRVYSGWNHSIYVPGRAGSGLFPKPRRNHMVQYSNRSTGGDRVQEPPDCGCWSQMFDHEDVIIFVEPHDLPTNCPLISQLFLFAHVSFFFGAETSLKPGEMKKLEPLSLRPSQICHLIQCCLSALQAVPQPSWLRFYSSFTSQNHQLCHLITRSNKDNNKMQPNVLQLLNWPLEEIRINKMHMRICKK